MTDERMRKLLAQAYKQASYSCDPSTQNGVLLVDRLGKEIISIGVNAPTPGLAMSQADWDRPNKYALVEHAERMAIYGAAAMGRRTWQTTMVAVWASCADCARAIVLAGVKCVVRHQRPGLHWSESIDIGDRILREAGVEVIDIQGPIPDACTVLFNGEKFDPTSEDC